MSVNDYERCIDLNKRSLNNVKDCADLDIRWSLCDKGRVTCDVEWQYLYQILYTHVDRSIRTIEAHIDQMSSLEIN